MAVDDKASARPTTAAAGAVSVMHALVENGADLLTSGNHIWDKRETAEFIAGEPRLLRPQNYPPDAPGRGWHQTRVGELTVGVFNTMGNVFMHPILDCPFQCADRLLETSLADCDIVLKDPELSRQHALIAVNGASARLQDLGSGWEPSRRRPR